MKQENLKVGADCDHCKKHFYVELQGDEISDYHNGKKMIVNCHHCKEKVDFSKNPSNKCAKCGKKIGLFSTAFYYQDEDGNGVRYCSDCNDKEKEGIKLEKDIRDKTEKPILEFRGRNGKLELYSRYVRINRGTAMGFLMQGLKGQKDIYFDKITSIQVKKPGLLIGYIQLSIGGGNESKRGVFNANTDENTVTFAYKDLYEEALKIKDYIEKHMNLKSATPQISDADEIEKMHNLMKKGIITKEEFEQKKKELLGLA